MREDGVRVSDAAVVTAVLGSPRRRGNSDTLAMEFLRGASSKGYKHRLIVPSELGISACDGGNQCFRDGRCIIRDGMNEMYDEILSARHLLIATPVYFMGPPGTLKSFIDRFQAVWARSALLKTFDPDSEARRRDHKAFAIIVGATAGRPDMYRPTLSIIKAFFNVAGFDYAGEVLATGLDRLGDVAKRQDLMSRIFEAGRDFIS
jgi:multimeric flavodoxin WrbA